MIAPPKLAREARRVAGQVAGLPALALDLALGRWRYDRGPGRLVERHEGRVAATRKAAVVLVFPRRGVLASHTLMLRHLVARGYAPVTVSNAPLAPADLDRLRALSRLVIVRPNIGYDFGGYRDGVLALGDGLAALDRLLLVNDSAWFPLDPGSDWLAGAEALGRGLVGSTTHNGMPRLPVARWHEFRFAHGTRSRDFHYSSFALLFGAEALRDPGFRRFWRRYRLTDGKARTVRRGEIGVTRWAIRRGHSHAAHPPPERVAETLLALPPDAMRRALERSFLIDDGAMHAERAGLLARDDGSEAWRDGAGWFLLACAARRGAAYVLWDHLARIGYPFLKKTPFWSADGDRAELPDDLSIDPAMRAAIREEIAAARAERGQADPRAEGERHSSTTPRR